MVVVVVLLSMVLLTYVVWQWRLRMLFLRLWGDVGSDRNTESMATLLVPFRNEIVNLPTLVDSLPSDWPAIFINDHSEDGGPHYLQTRLADRPADRLLHLADYLGERPVTAYKKAALTYGIASADSEVIITTDADCRWPPGAPAELLATFGEDTVAVCGPVEIVGERHGLLYGLQALDLWAYQFLTAAWTVSGRPGLANGACFAFRRGAFAEVNGYGGMDHLPSGDDVLLLHKMAEHYPPEAFRWSRQAEPVATRAVTTWRAFWRQRLRWAGKAGHYRNRRLDVAQALTFAANGSLLVLAGLLFFLPLRPRLVVLAVMAAKLAVDYLNLRLILGRYGRTRLLRHYPAVALVYPFYLVAIGGAALLGVKTEWKGRT